MTDVQFRNLSKSFGLHSILVDIDLEIKAASSSCWSGRRGAAKSTLLRMLAGLETISSGDLVIGGLPVTVEPRNTHLFDRTTGLPL